MSIHSSMYSLDTYCSTSLQFLEIVFTTVLALNVGVLQMPSRHMSLSLTWKHSS